MEQRKEIITHFVGSGLSVTKATEIAGVKRSTYYYRCNGKLKGKKPSDFTIKDDGTTVSNDHIVKEILEMLSHDFIDYGYHTITHLLKRKGYKINHKKVYRLMKEHKLTFPVIIKPIRFNKQRIDTLVPPLVAPFETVEADIKYVYIHEQNRNAFLLTFLCTFCRYAPVWELEYTMKSNQVIRLVERFLNDNIVRYYTHNKKIKIKIRTDNGPQFIAKNLAEVFNKLDNIEHEFIHPGTPQENGHIESFHSTVTKLACNPYIYQSLSHAKATFNDFFKTYNNVRVMKSLLYYPPFEFLKIWNTGSIGVKKNNKNKEIFYFKEKPVSNDETDNSTEVFLGINKFSNFDNILINPL